jgi:hypothetical protein
MTGSALERRYRRLLAAYPLVYRRRHEDEMLAVLLSGAQPGQRRPRPAEIADLLVGAMRMRLRLVQPYPGDAGADALAIFTVVAPLLLVGAAVVTLVLHLARFPPTPGIPASVGPALRRSLEAFYTHRHILELRYTNGIDFMARAEIALAIAAALRLKAVALALTAITLGWWIFSGQYEFSAADPFDEFFLICCLLQAAALLASLGPRRGLQLLTWKSLTVLVAAAAALTISWTFWMRLAFKGFGPSESQPRELVAATTAVVLIGAVVALASRPGRYLVSLYATMFYPIALYLGSVAENDLRPIPLAVKILPPLIVGCGIIVVARRRAGRLGSEQRSGRSAPA